MAANTRLFLCCGSWADNVFGAASPSLPVVAVLVPYWSFWEATVGSGLRAEREALAAAAVRSLERVATVASVTLVDSQEGAARAADLARPEVQTLLVLQTMAVPPAYTLAYLDRAPQVPIVVWALHREGVVGEAFDHAAITAQGATVGTPMLTSSLIRRGRPFDLVLGRLDDPLCLERVRRAVHAAGVTGQLRRARVGLVGTPLDGYDCVEVDAGRLKEATGLEVVPIEHGAVLERWRAVERREVERLAQEVGAVWECAPDVDEGEALVRSLRAAVAMERIVEDFRLDAGAMNCHVPEIRFGQEIGMTPCYALGRLTSRGAPWTCTGDVPTAVAMLTVKRMGGVALYHELEAVDYATGEFVIASSGEHDLGWCAPGERPRLRRNGWFDGIDPRCGVCGCFGAAPGPGTLVAFTPHPRATGGFRFVTAYGEITPRRFPQTGTVNGAFRFASGPPEEAWTRWVTAGVSHHSCATLGDCRPAIKSVAMHLGIEAVEV